LRQVESDKPGARQRKIGIDADPGAKVVFIRDLHAGAHARGARGGRASVPLENKLRTLLQIKKADRAVEIRYRLGANADLGANGSHQKWRSALRRTGIAGDFYRGYAARVVAVVAGARSEEQFRLVEGAERHGEFRTGDCRVWIAGVRRLQNRIH